VKQNGWKDEFSAALIGSCTNSSYEDMVGDFYPGLHAEVSDYSFRPGLQNSRSKQKTLD
jgi:hypothetical protein